MILKKTKDIMNLLNGYENFVNNSGNQTRLNLGKISMLKKIATYSATQAYHALVGPK